MKKALIIYFLIYAVFITKCYAFEYNDICNKKYFKHNEKSYQKAWCNIHNGILEYKNSDLTRIDCLTKAHAVEFDFATKWAESVGQALHYGMITGKKPKIVLILNNPKAQMVYYKRVKAIGEKYNIDTEYVTNDILNTNEQGICQNPKCKCRKIR